MKKGGQNNNSVFSNILESLNDTQWKILTHISTNKPQTITDISNFLKIAYVNTFKNLKQLEKKGLIGYKKTKSQNNPSFVIPLMEFYVGDDINGFKEEKKNHVKGILTEIYTHKESNDKNPLKVLENLIGAIKLDIGREVTWEMDWASSPKIKQTQIQNYVFYKKSFVDLCYEELSRK